MVSLKVERPEMFAVVTALAIEALEERLAVSAVVELSRALSKTRAWTYSLRGKTMKLSIAYLKIQKIIFGLEPWSVALVDTTNDQIHSLTSRKTHYKQMA